MKKIILSISFIVYLFFLLPYSTTMANEEASYKVVHKNEIYEIRHYSDRLVVQVMNKNDNNGFRKLFNYISGANIDSEKIKMTTPVTQSEESSEMVMQFYLPSKFTKKTAPVPTDPRVKLITIEEGHYAVIKYSGRLTDKNFNKHKKILKENLIEDKIEIIGPAIKATYNGPFTLPMLRRNEAMFHVDWRKN